MASVKTHRPYRPGPWALEQIRQWQADRAAGMKAVLDLVDKVGAAGVMCSDRVHGFWFEADRPNDPPFWKHLRSPNTGSFKGTYRSAIGPTGRLVWEPRRKVEIRGQERLSPLYDEVHDIRLKDWWHLAVAFGLRPVFWPSYGLMLLPELDVVGDHGEHVILWSPKDRFGIAADPFDCEPLTRQKLKRIYAEAWRDVLLPPVVESYIGDDIRFRFANDRRDNPPPGD